MNDVWPPCPGKSQPHLDPVGRRDVEECDAIGCRGDPAQAARRRFWRRRSPPAIGAISQQNAANKQYANGHSLACARDHDPAYGGAETAPDNRREFGREVQNAHNPPSLAKFNRSDGFETNTAELNAAGMRLKPDEAGRIGQAPLWMRSVAAGDKGETRYLSAVQTHGVQLIHNFDLEHVPLSERVGCDL